MEHASQKPLIAVVAVIAIATLVPASLPVPASAETIGAMLRRDCANGPRAKDLESKGDDAENLAEFSDSRAYYGEAAKLEYYCAKETNDPYAHDWYRYFYALDLYGSIEYTNDPGNSIAYGALNDLAAATQYDDVRKAALDERDRIRHQIPSIAE